MNYMTKVKIFINLENRKVETISLDKLGFNY